MKIIAVAVNTFRESIRNQVIYSVVLFAVVVVGASAFFGAVSIGKQTEVIKDFGLFSLSFFGAIITILCGVSLLNKELKQKTVYNILSKPVARWQFIVGKHFGLSLTVSMLICMMCAALAGFVALFEGRIDWLLFQAGLFVMLEVWVIAATALFFSSLVVTTTLTGLFTLGTYLAGRSISYLKYFTAESETNPLTTAVIGALDAVLPDLSLFNFNDLIVYGQPATLSDLTNAFLYAACYCVVALSLASMIFAKRELV